MADDDSGGAGGWAGTLNVVMAVHDPGLAEQTNTILCSTFVKGSFRTRRRKTTKLTQQ